MSTVAFIRRMLDAGFTHDDALRAAEAFEASVEARAPARSKGALRQARYEERQRQKASESVSSDGADGSDVRSPSLPSSPQTPQQPTHPPVEITTRAKAVSRSARRCPEDWSPSPADLAAEPQLTPGEIERELAKFRDHTFGTARSDWSATFRNWIRRAAESKPRHERPSNQNQPRQDRVSRMLAGAVAAADGP